PTCVLVLLLLRTTGNLWLEAGFLTVGELMVISPASSDGRRNTGLQCTRRSLESQSFPWALIQAQRDLVELRLRDRRQVRSSREVLPQEQVRTFVRATLPGTLRIAKINLHIRRHCKLLVLGHLQSAIPGQRAAQRRRKFTDMLTQGSNHRFRFFARYFDQHEKAGMPLH